MTAGPRIVRTARPAIAAALAALLAAAPAAARLDPAHRWRTIDTPHFSVHFHEGCDALAERAAAIAETAHAQLAPRVGWEPRGRTQLILSDDEDDAAGWATPYPYNQMLVSTASPLGELGLGATRFDDWLRLVITHEYTHVLQMDMLNGGLGSVMRPIFGRLYFPNAHQPI